MYTPQHFNDLDAAGAYAFMMAYPFGLAVTVEEDTPFVSHVPFLADPAAGRLRWHLAAANPQCGQLAARQRALLVFHGPHAYISPRWYRQPNVPTWNYVAVHVEGEVRCLDAAETAATVADLARVYEGAAGLGTFAESPAYGALLGAIRGFELTVRQLTAKRKLSQNRPVADQQGVVTQLLSSPDSQVRAVGELMRENLARVPP